MQEVGCEVHVPCRVPCHVPCHDHGHCLVPLDLGLMELQPEWRLEQVLEQVLVDQLRLEPVSVEQVLEQMRVMARREMVMVEASLWPVQHVQRGLLREPI